MATVTEILRAEMARRGWTDEEAAAFECEHHYEDFRIKPRAFVRDKGRWADMVFLVSSVLPEGMAVRDAEGVAGAISERYLRDSTGKALASIKEMLQFDATQGGRWSDELQVEGAAAASTAYSVIRRNPASLNPATGEHEILSAGSEGTDLRSALIECDARNRLLGEGQPAWSVEPAPDAGEVSDLSIEPDEVFDCLVRALGVDPAEAARLLA